MDTPARTSTRQKVILEFSVEFYFMGLDGNARPNARSTNMLVLKFFMKFFFVVFVAGAGRERPPERRIDSNNCFRNSCRIFLNDRTGASQIGTPAQKQVVRVMKFEIFILGHFWL